MSGTWRNDGKKGAGGVGNILFLAQETKQKKHDAALTQQDLNNQPIFMARSMIFRWGFIQASQLR